MFSLSTSRNVCMFAWLYGDLKVPVAVLLQTASGRSWATAVVCTVSPISAVEACKSFRGVIGVLVASLTSPLLACHSVFEDGLL